MIRSIGIAALGVFAAAAGTSAAAQESWRYEVMPFLWASDIEGREGIRDTVADVDASFSDLIEFVDIGAALRFRAERDPMVWFAETSYVELGDTARTGIGDVSVELTQTFAEAGMSYRFAEQLAVYGALRYQKVEAELRAASGAFRTDADWLDAVAGLHWTPIRSDSWGVWARGDLGGGGSDLVWLAEVGAGYRFSPRWAAYLFYRILDTDYERSGFVYDIEQSGLALWFGFSF